MWFLPTRPRSESFRDVHSKDSRPGLGPTAAHARVWRWHSHSVGRRECSTVGGVVGLAGGWVDRGMP